jgi:cold shock CspA family protein
MSFCPGTGGNRPANQRTPPKPPEPAAFAGCVRFIELGDGSKDVFVHASALRTLGLATLYEGQHVTMLVVQGNKGPEAAEVTVVT